jgi:hypothetical protein
LSGPFAPTSDQPWLAITGVTGGVVCFSFTANPGPARTANITLLGQTIPVTQTAAFVVPAPVLANPQLLGNGLFQFGFTNYTTGVSFTVLTTTNLALPLANWTVLGAPTNLAPGVFQFTTPAPAGEPQRFYCVSSP